MDPHAKRAHRVLVVDDDRTMRVLLAAFLKAGGHEVEVVTTGGEAIDAAERRPPDLVLVDYVMVPMSGPEVVRGLRALPRMRDVPVLMLTGRDIDAGLHEAAQSGADDYLLKPIDRKTLLARVAAALETHARRRPSVAPRPAAVKERS